MIIGNFTSLSRDSSPLLRGSASLKPQVTIRSVAAVNQLEGIERVRNSSSPRFRPISASPPVRKARKRNDLVHFSPHMGVRLTVSLQRLHEKRRIRVEQMLHGNHPLPPKLRSTRMQQTPSPRLPEDLSLRPANTVAAGIRLKDSFLHRTAVNEETTSLCHAEIKARIAGFDTLLQVKKIMGGQRSARLERMAKTSALLERVGKKYSARGLQRSQITSNE